MSKYRRIYVEGGTYFFTVNLADRKSHLLIDHFGLLRTVFCEVRTRHPFTLDAYVVLPDHLHCIWTLPEGDKDFSRRWRLIKSNFSRKLPKSVDPSTGRRPGERGIWQRRFWEHVVRNDADYRMHANYIHHNPLKHGWVTDLDEWPYSSWHQLSESNSDNWLTPTDDLAVGERGEDW